MSDRNKKRIIIASILIVVVLTIVGMAVQVVDVDVRTKAPGNEWGMPIVEPITFNPFKCIAFAVGTSMGWGIIAMIIVAIVFTFILVKINGEGRDMEDERNFTHSKKGTYGTAGWMTNSELKAILAWKDIASTDGTILGKKDGRIISLPTDAKINKHTAIFGASGTGKSRCFVRPQILQCVRRGESVIITDPKGEIYADTAEFMRQNGYNVKMFNLVDPKYSDSWNCLAEITANPENVELMAQTFTEVIIKNTDEGGGDHFWSNSEGNLLKALALYIALDDSRDEEQKNIGAMYEMLTNNDEKKLDAMFSKLPIGHPAKQPWSIFKQGGDAVKANTIIGLGARLQVFQSDIIRKITAFKEIDLEEPARRKSAYFVIMSDQDSTLNFLSSLFFSFLFIRLVRYADVKGKDGKCDVFVNFILDEFPNIGQIPDFTKKLSTIRSRELRVAVIFQNIAQLENRYPDGLWEEIVGNCDTQLFLGCTDATTAKFISERTGEMTIEVKSTGVQKQAIAIAQDVNSYKETESVGKRFVMTADEVMRLPNTNALVILRGQKVLKVEKFDISQHPGEKNFIHTYVRDYIPEWRRRLDAANDADNENDENEELDITKSDEIDNHIVSTMNNGPRRRNTRSVATISPDSEPIIKSVTKKAPDPVRKDETTMTVNKVNTGATQKKKPITKINLNGEEQRVKAVPETPVKKAIPIDNSDVPIKKIKL